jgi:hypothetical protein
VQLWAGALAVAVRALSRHHSTPGQISPVAFDLPTRREDMEAMENGRDYGFPPRPHPYILSGTEARKREQRTQLTCPRNRNVSLNFASWNQTMGWIRVLDSLRQTA